MGYHEVTSYWFHGNANDAARPAADADKRPSLRRRSTKTLCRSTTLDRRTPRDMAPVAAEVSQPPLYLSFFADRLSHDGLVLSRTWLTMIQLHRNCLCETSCSFAIHGRLLRTRISCFLAVGPSGQEGQDTGCGSTQ